MPKPEMTAEQFERLLPALKRLTLETVDIARDVLVHGKTQTEVAKERGKTKQRVGQLVQQVLAKRDDIPEGWEYLELWVPAELASDVRSKVEGLRATKDKETGK